MKNSGICSRPTLIAITIIFAMALLGISNVGASSKIAANITKLDGNMLQFKAGNHILGFSPNKAYLAAMDHALSVEFLGTKGVMPKAEGNVPSKKDDKAAILGKVTYQNLWEGISLTYEPAKDGLTESTYFISPNADVSKIKLKYNVPVSLQKNGALRLTFNNGYMTESAPVAWQDINGKRIPVKVAFDVSDGNVGFKLGSYDKKYTLIIDPKYLWHTFYGSSDRNDWGSAIAIDSSGNIFITGTSMTNWLGPNSENPVNAHAYTPANPISADIVVIKLNSSGEYQWHTFHGGDDKDGASSIATDSSGDVYITGLSKGAWLGTTVNAPLNNENGLFVLKLNGSNGAYKWHTFYSASVDLNMQSNGIAVDSNSNVYVTGVGWRPWWGPDGEAPLNGTSGLFILKLNTNGAYQWHTHYGSDSEGGAANSITTDSDNNLYIAGNSDRTWNGHGGQLPVHAHSGMAVGYDNYDIFVLSLDSVGSYRWHTFYGLYSYNSIGKGITTDSSGNVYVTGYSATWTGESDAAPLHAHSGNYTDSFVLKLARSDGAYQWHTFYGGAGDDYGTGIATDNSGNVFISGYSYQSWLGPNNKKPTHNHSGKYDIFVLKLNSDGAYRRHTFYGSSSNDYGYGIVLDSSSNVYVTGYSTATWSADGTAPLKPYAGDYDIVVLKLDPCSKPVMSYWILFDWFTEYLSFSDAYADTYAFASDGNYIAMRSVTFNTALNLTQPMSISIYGGYSCDYTSVSGYTTIPILTIGGSSGAVTIDRVIIK